MLVGLGHLDLVCRDLDASLAFYAAVFGPIGLEPPHVVPGERGEQIPIRASPGRLRARSGCGRRSPGVQISYTPDCTPHVPTIGNRERAPVFAADGILRQIPHAEAGRATSTRRSSRPDGFPTEVAASRDSRP
jgi:catechol 2,3-dioxygenase-like lactoylglutathione lyase family enzyme